MKIQHNFFCRENDDFYVLEVPHQSRAKAYEITGKDLYQLACDKRDLWVWDSLDGKNSPASVFGAGNEPSELTDLLKAGKAVFELDGEFHEITNDYDSIDAARDVLGSDLYAIKIFQSIEEFSDYADRCVEARTHKAPEIFGEFKKLELESAA